MYMYNTMQCAFCKNPSTLSICEYFVLQAAVLLSVLLHFFKPKYIHNLLKTSEQRKKEYERRVERKVQKEREAEAGQFDDSEKFVTSAYKKKMQEMQEEEERERRQEALEGM